jgi:hypothetical protein
MFDIISISCQYRFNWIEVFGHAKKKAIINELDVSERIFSFPSEWLENVEWLQTPVDITVIEQRLKTIANDFIAGADNSLCKNGIFIEKAQVIL